MKKQTAKRIIMIVIAVMLVFMIIPGVYFDIAADDGVTVVHYIKNHTSLFFVVFILLMIACYTTIRFIYKKLDQINERNLSNSFQQKRSLLLYWVIIIICWLPYLIICFPASSIGWDYNWQLLQGMGVVPLSNHHPVLGSLIYGLLYKIGFIIGGAYGGLFFTVFFQVALMSFAMAYGVFTLRRMGVSTMIAYCLLFFICINPVFAGHAVWLIKDSIYASLIVILLTLCLNYSLNKNNTSYPILLGIFGFLSTMYRSEGIVVVSLLFLILIVDIFRKARKALCRILVSFSIVLVTFVSFQIGIRASGIPSTSTARESLTLFSAQIMDCLKNNPTDISEREMEVLRKSYDDLDAAVLKYDEVNRDPVKTIDMSFSNTVEYLKVWLQIGIRHKGDYIDSFLRGTNGYWWMFIQPSLIAHTTPLYSPEDDFANNQRRDMPAMNNGWLKKTYEAYGIETDKTIGELVHENNADLEGVFYVRSLFSEARDSLNGFLDGWKNLPMLQFVFVPGFYFVVSLLSLGYLYINKRAIFWQCIPIMVIMIINCLSPINGYMRYFLPVALSSLLIMGLCFTGKDNRYLEAIANERNSNPNSVLQ